MSSQQTRDQVAPADAGRARDREADRRTLGSAIRSLRTAQQRTLSDVATAAGISISLLSQVERGLVDPSLDSLRDIAGALGTMPFKLLQNGAPRSGVVRRAERLHLRLPERDDDYELLSPSLDGAFEVAEWTVQPGNWSSAQPRSHSGEEATLILAGRVLLELGGELVELEEGDCITFDARVPHRHMALGDDPATGLFIVSPPSF
jgi:transcriptional regulator with XRE-family HTH domain